MAHATLYPLKVMPAMRHYITYYKCIEKMQRKGIIIYLQF